MIASFVRPCFLLLALNLLPLPVASVQAQQIDYPPAHRSDQTDRYHGVEVADPYRWMEDMDAPSTRAWMQAQDSLLTRYVGAVPERDALQQRIEVITDIERYFFVSKRGDSIFFFKSEPDRDQPVLYVQDGLDGTPRVLFDPQDELTGDERLASYSASPDGRRIAIGFSRGQSNWQRYVVRDVAGGATYPDKLLGIRGGMSWLPNGSGFYYTYYEPPGEGEELTAQLSDPDVFFHRIGTRQHEDRLVYERPDRPQWLLSPQVTRDGRYLLINVAEAGSFTGLVDQVYIQDLRTPEHPIAPLFTTSEGTFQVLGTEGNRLWVRTTHEAPRGRIVAVDLNRTASAQWQEVVHEAEHTVARAWMLGGRLIVQYNRDARPHVTVFDRSGAPLYDLDLPDVGMVGAFTGDPDDADILFRFNGLYDPGTTFQLDLRTGRTAVVLRPDLSFDPDAFVTRQVFYTSGDGTRVPMFVSHQRGLKRDGTAPTFLYAYGVFGWSAFPWYQPHVIAWMEMGGIYALPNIRGGGEYGAAWHAAGSGLNQPNSIADYLAAAAWLVEENYTRPDRLVANGGSASGFLPAVAITQRPDLFGASVINIPALDKLRYHRFTGAGAWVPEFGSVEDPEAFRVLHSYSPYHNIKPGTCYPPTLVTVGERDETAPPLHGYKFVAAMQAAQACSHPVMLKIAWGAGHSYGTTRRQVAATWATTWAFLLRTLDLDIAACVPAEGSR